MARDSPPPEPLLLLASLSLRFSAAKVGKRAPLGS